MTDKIADEIDENRFSFYLLGGAEIIVNELKWIEIMGELK